MAQCLDSAPPSPLSHQHRPLSARVTFTSISQLEDTPAEAVKCGQGKFKSENAAVSHPVLFKTAEAIALARLPITKVHITQAESVRSSHQRTNPTSSLVAPGLNQRVSASVPMTNATRMKKAPAPGSSCSAKAALGSNSSKHSKKKNPLKISAQKYPRSLVPMI